MTRLENKYRQLEYKANKVWDYYYLNNDYSPKRGKLIIIWNKIWDIIFKLKKLENK